MLGKGGGREKEERKRGKGEVHWEQLERSQGS